MSTAIEAVYEKGVLRPLQQLELAEVEKISVILVKPAEAKFAAMQEAMSDPLFLADLQDVSEDFLAVDTDIGIEKYWADTNIDDIRARILEWKKR